jgi:hypothetical protein
MAIFCCYAEKYCCNLKISLMSWLGKKSNRKALRRCSQDPVYPKVDVKVCLIPWPSPKLKQSGARETVKIQEVLTLL